MSEPKIKTQDSAALEAVIKEIQQTGINILETGAALARLESKMVELQQRKADIQGGQKFFTLEDE